jgi:EAL domain-containing protein (putative c-di-GMP-specific phosphodiesterase class I)
MNLTSIGAATTSEPSHAKNLLGEADVALYEAKRLGGDKVVVFEEALESTRTRRDQVTHALREADFDEEFWIAYQPIVTAETAEISTLEALLRWTSPKLGELEPEEFIPVAEITDEILPLGTWVFDQVCKQVAYWNDAGMDPNIGVSVNVSPRQLLDESFVSYVLQTARTWGVKPTQLIIEITESAVLDYTGDARSRLEQLRAAGFRISIDDFGSGYSNLGQLLAVPFDIIKVDRSLLLTLSDMRDQRGGDPAEPCAIMEAIVSIASILGAPVVCEGVETEIQLDSLRASGITHIQGFLTGRPSPADHFTSLLCRRSAGVDRRT